MSTSGSDQQHREFWLGLLSKNLDRPSLLLDRKRSAEVDPKTERITHPIGKSLCEALEQLAGGSPILRLTAFVTTVIACLCRHSEERRALIGTPALKEQPEQNAVVLAVEADDQTTYRDLLPAVREALLAAYEHQAHPIEQLRDDLELPSPPAGPCPFFDILVCQEGLHGTPPVLHQDLTLEIGQEAIHLIYPPALFHPETVERFVRQILTTLAQGIEGLSTPLAELSGMDETERDRLVALSSGERVSHPTERAIHQLFEAIVPENDSQPALRSETETLNYAELDRRANGVAHRLAAKGVGPGELVGLLVERSFSSIIGLLGIHKANGVCLPLDPSYPDDRLAFMVQDAAPRLLLTTSQLSSRLAAKEVLLLSDEEAADPPRSTVSGGDLAYCLYTSGSTGRPKGVLLTHRGLVNRMCAGQRAHPLSSADRVLHQTAQSFDVAVGEIYGALTAGAELVIAPRGSPQNVDQLLETIVAQRVTVARMVPTLLTHVVEHERFHSCQLRLLISAGEPLPVALAERFLAESSARIVNTYAPTEATIDTTSGAFETGSYPRVAPLGRPIDNMSIYVLDQQMRLVPQGAPGEACIAGPGVARGYLGREALTAERFVPNPFMAGRLYRSGDRVRYQPDGQLEFLGRADRQVKLRGQRIELEEIEIVLAEHEAIQHCFVAVKELEKRSQLVAYVVTHQERAVDIQELRERAMQKLPQAMVPAAFVQLSALPRLPNGKVDRAALPAPGSERPKISSLFVAPRNERERKLVAIWQEVLKIDQIGVEDSFFELGGDSILTLLVASKSRAAGLTVTPRHLHEQQTVAAIIRVLDSGASKPAPAAAPPASPIPLTPVQRWLFETAPANPHHLNQSFLLRVMAPVEPERMRTALTQVVARHAALGFRFSQAKGARQAMQQAGGEAGFETVDLRPLPVTTARALLQQQAAKAQGRLNIHQGPILRAIHFQMPGVLEDRLFLAAHHLVIDGVSWRVLLEDLSAALRGEPIAEEVTTFQTFSEQLERHVDRLSEQLPHWRSVGTEDGPLPRDHQGENTNASRREISQTLSAEQTSVLQKTRRVMDALTLAFVRSLSSWTGRAEVRCDFEGHGREALFGGDLSRTIGWFTSLYPVHLQVDLSMSLAAQMCGVADRLAQVPDGGVGFGILRYLGPEPVQQELAQRSSEIQFNFLGDLDRLVPQGGLFQLAPEETGEEESREGQRRYLLEVNTLFAAGQLQVSCRYSENLHQEETIQRLMTSFLAEVEQITRALQDGQMSRTGEAEEGPLRPEDFPEAGLDQADLNKIFARTQARRTKKK